MKNVHKILYTGNIDQIWATGRKAVAEVASYNSLGKVSRMGWTKSTYGLYTSAQSTSNIKYNEFLHRIIKCHVDKETWQWMGPTISFLCLTAQ